MLGTLLIKCHLDLLYRDIFPLLRDPAVFSDLVDVLVDHVKALNVDVVVGLEARGFLLGPIISHQLKVPFVPIRKKGKLPGPTIKVEYQLEYGTVSKTINFLVNIYVCTVL